jgi:hypothetical protein
MVREGALFVKVSPIEEPIFHFTLNGIYLLILDHPKF